MIYSCAYPIPIALNWSDESGVIDYNGLKVPYEIWILDENDQYTQVYDGVIFGDASGRPPEIDISGVCREYLDVFYERVQWPSAHAEAPADGMVRSIHRFELTSAYGGGQVMVMYNYNTDYQHQFPDAMLISDPLTLDVDPRQMLPISSYNIAGEDVVSIVVNGNQRMLSMGGRAITLNGFAVTRAAGDRDLSGVSSGEDFHFSIIDLSEVGVGAGDHVDVYSNGVRLTFNVVPPCRNRFVIYYINKAGGLDALLCAGKATESWSPTREDVRVYDSRADRRDFQARRVHTDLEKRYQLNTPLLADEAAAKIDNVIYAPKVWVHDLEKNTITSCMIDDADYTIKTFRNDRVVQYTITLSESQLYIRR